MRTALSMTLMLAAGAATSFAQPPAPAPTVAAPPSTLRLTVDDAVKMAIEHNVDLSAERLDPQIGDMRVAAASGAFRPTFNTGVQRNNQLQPPSSFLIPTPTQTDAVTSSAGLSQRLPWFGTSYSVSWNAVHTNSNSFLNSYNPLLQSGLSVNVSQPLVRDLPIDAARQQLVSSRINRDIADTRLRETLVQTTAGVKSAYWNLVAAIANVDARKSALDLAQELVRVNKAKVDVGQSPPLDLVSAQAEVASDQEQLIIGETGVKESEDRLRALIFDTSDRSVWNVKIDPVDQPPIGLMAPDLDAAVTNALRDRTDLVRARKDIDNAQVSVKYAGNQRLPDVRMNAKRIETTRAARELAEQRLDAERKRFEVGMSTSFLVIQAQRDLAQAKTNELSAVLAYDLALVDFDALQQAGPAGPPSTGVSSTGQAADASTAPTPAAATSTGATTIRTTGPTTGLPGNIPGLPGGSQDH